MEQKMTDSRLETLTMLFLSPTRKLIDTSSEYCYLIAF